MNTENKNEVFDEMSKEDIWHKWQSDKKQMKIFIKALDHFGIKNYDDIEKLSELYDVNNNVEHPFFIDDKKLEQKNIPAKDWLENKNKKL
jgi:hypothetical protein